MTIYRVQGRRRKRQRNKPGLLLVLSLAWFLPRSIAQTGPSGGRADTAAAATDVTGNSFIVEIKTAPQPGGEAVLTLLGAVRDVAVLQWQRKGVGEAAFVDVPTATSTTLNIAAVTMAMNGDEFRCIITDATGSAVSSAATLVVGPPTLAIVDGNRQITEPGKFNARPFDVAVWDATGTQPLVDASVTFTVQSGGGLLGTTNTDASSLASSLTLTTDEDGTVKAYYRHASVSGILSEIKAMAGSREVIFHSTSLLAGAEESLQAGGGERDEGGVRSATTGKGQKAGAVSGGKGRLAAFGVGGVRAGDLEFTARAMTFGPPGLQLVLRTRANQYHAVNTSTWEITSTAAP